MGFIEALTNHCEDGRIVCSRQAFVSKGVLKFLLLNPAVHFKEIVDKARLVYNCIVKKYMYIYKNVI